MDLEANIDKLFYNKEVDYKINKLSNPYQLERKYGRLHIE